MTSSARDTLPGFLVRERALVIGTAATLVFLVFGNSWTKGLDSWLAGLGLFAVLFAVMMSLSFAVVRHAESLAILLGEPLGTLILTISVISIEVIMITAVMVTGENQPTVARDTMFAVLMIVLNLMFGLAMLLAGWRHHEPAYNNQGANAYLGVLVPLALLTLVLPRFTAEPGGEASPLVWVLLIVLSIVLYGVFLGIQTMRHRHFFTLQGTTDDHDHGEFTPRTVRYHAVLLPLTVLPIVVLSKFLAEVIDYGIAELSAPAALGGFLVAALVLAPEGIAAMKAALDNRLQRSFNIALGSGLATVSLTVPAVLIIGLVTDRTVELGLDAVSIVVLAATLLAAMLNTSSGRTNVLQGVVHLSLFATYVVLIFD